MGYDPFIGEITLFAGNFVPEGYLPCDGRLLTIQGNEALFSILGIQYGGDGRSNFALPDLRGHVAVGRGQAPGMIGRYDIGTRGGQEVVELNVNHLPSHNHTAKIAEAHVATTVTMKASSADGGETSPEGGIPAVINRPASGPGQPVRQFGYTKNAPNVDMKPTPVNFKLENVNVEVDPTGGSQPLENRQPYLAIQYIIAVRGIYPTRS